MDGLGCSLGVQIALSLSYRDVDFLGHNSHDSFLAECISNGDDALIFLLINFEKKIPSPFVFLGGEEGVVVV